jgi:hypothetical protein
MCSAAQPTRRVRTVDVTLDLLWAASLEEMYDTKVGRFADLAYQASITFEAITGEQLVSGASNDNEVRSRRRGESGGDVFNMEGSFGDSHHEPKRVVVGQFDRFSVHIKEYGRRQPPKPFVAIDECVIGHD